MRKNIILSGLMILILPCVFSQQNDKYTLSIDEAVMLAMVKNIDIRSDQLNLDQKKWAVATCWNKFIPSVSMTAALTNINQSLIDDAKRDLIDQVISDNNISESEAENTTEYKERWGKIPKGKVSTSINLSFNFAANMIFDVMGTAIVYKKGLISSDMAKFNITNGVKKIYYSLVILNEQVNMMKENLDAAQKRFEVANKKFKSELISELEKLNAEYTYEDMKVKLAECQNKQQDLLDDFKQLVGVKNGIEIELTGKIELPANYSFNSEELISKYLDKNFEIQSMNIDYNIIQNERNRYISLLTPTLSISFIADPSYQKSDPFGSDKEWFSDIKKDWRQTQGSFTFAVSLPLDSWVPFSTPQMGIINTAYELKRQKLLIEKTKGEKENKIREIVRDLEKIDKILNSLKIKVDMANKAYALSEHSYEAGLKLYIEVIDAQQNANNARLDLLNAQYEYLSGLMDLAYNLNLADEDFLKK